jgi:hypothetical protein
VLIIIALRHQTTPHCIHAFHLYGAVGGDILDPLYTWDRKWVPRKRKLLYKTLKGILYQEILQRGTERSVASSRSADATSVPTVEISAKVRDEPIVRNLI